MEQSFHLRQLFKIILPALDGLQLPQSGTVPEAGGGRGGGEIFNMAINSSVRPFRSFYRLERQITVTLLQNNNSYGES